MLPSATQAPLYFLKSNKVSDQPGMVLMGNPPRWHKMTPDMKGGKDLGHVVQDPHDIAAVNQLKNKPAFQKLSPDEQLAEVKAAGKAHQESSNSTFEGKIQSGKLPSLSEWQAFMALPREKKAELIDGLKKDPQAGAYFEEALDNFKAMAAANIQSNKSSETKESKGLDLKSAYLPESNVNAKTINKKLDTIQKLVDANDIEGLEAMKFGVNGYNKKLAVIVKNIVEGLKAKGAQVEEPTQEPKEEEKPKIKPMAEIEKPKEPESTPDKAEEKPAEAKAPSASQYEAIAAMIDAFYLPATNVNSKSANKKLDHMKELVMAGNTASLGDLKFGVNTYGKKHQKLRDALVSALEKGLDNTSAPNQDEKKHDPTLAEGSDDQGASAKDIGTKPAEKEDLEASGYKIYKYGNKWAVQTDDNKSAGKIGLGDVILTTKEEAIAEAQKQQVKAESKAKMNAELAEKAKADQQKKAEKKDIDGFGADKTQVQQAKIASELAKEFNTPYGVMSVKNFIKKLIADGATVDKDSFFDSEKYYKDQETLSELTAPAAIKKDPLKVAKLKEKLSSKDNYNQSESYLVSSDGKSYSKKSLGQYGLQYAEYLTSNGEEKESPKDGDTKEGADGTLIFKDGRWHKQGEPDKQYAKTDIDEAIKLASAKAGESGSTSADTEYAQKVRVALKLLGLDAKVHVTNGGGSVSVVTKTFEKQFTENEKKAIHLVLHGFGLTGVKGIDLSEINTADPNQIKGYWGYDKKITKVWLNVPYPKKDVAKNQGAKWDAEKKLWYAPVIDHGTGPHGIHGALSSFVPDHAQVSSSPDGMKAASLNLSQETGKDYAVHMLVDPATNITGYYVATPDGVASDDYTEKQISGWEKHGPVGGGIKSTEEVDKETGGAGSKFIDALLNGKTPDPELTTALGGFKSDRYVELMQLAQNKWLKQQGLSDVEGADSLASTVLYDHILGATHHEGDVKTADGKSFTLKNNQWQPLSPQKDDPLVSKAKALNELNPHDLVHDLYTGKVSKVVDEQIEAVGKEAAGDFYQSFKAYQESPNYKNLVAAVCAAYGKPGMVLMATGRWVKADEVGSSNDLLFEGSMENVKKACLADMAYLLKDEPSSGPENPEAPQTFNNGTITFHGAATFNDLMQKKGWEVSDGAKPTVKFIKSKLDWSISPGQFIEDKAEWEKKKWYLKDLLPEGSAIVTPSGKNVISYDGNVMKFTNEQNVVINDWVLDKAGVNNLLAGLWYNNTKIIPPGNPQLSAVGEAKEDPAEPISEGKESSGEETYKNPLDIPEAQNVLDMLASGFPPFKSDQQVVKQLSKTDQGEVLFEAAKKYAINTDLNLSDADDMLFAADLMADLFHGGDAPMEGDTKTKNGIVYQLINGKWHRITPKEKGDAAASSHPLDAIQIPEEAINNSKWNPSVKNNIISSLNALKENAKTEGMAAFKGVLANYASKSKSIVKLKYGLGGIDIHVYDSQPDDSIHKQVKKCIEDLKAATQIASGKKVKKAKAKPEPIKKPSESQEPGSNNSKDLESIDNWKQVGPQGGYNPGGTYKDGDGVDWYCKFPKGGESVVKNELLALKLYKAAGIEVPEVKMVTQNGQLGLASRIVDGAKEDKDKLKKGEGKGLLDGFAVDAWLANWDVVGNNPAAGKGFDNILFKKDGSAVRIDAGGAILFGGAGSAKGEMFGDTVEDIQSMLDASKNANTAKVFGSMTEADLKASATKVASIPDFRIESLILRYGPGTYIERKKLLAKLLSRKNSIALQYGINQAIAEAEEVIEKPDPTKLKVKPKDLPTKPDYINGVGVQKSSHEKINELNQQSVDEMEASALKGNLVELKALEVHQLDKETGKTTLKSAKDHPSKYAKDYFENLVSTMDTIANPSAKKMKDWVGRASKTVGDLSENFKAHLYGIAIKHLPANERLGFWISLGNATDYENLVPENQHWVTQKDKTKGVQSIQSMPEILKTWLAAVKQSGAYNQPYRDGDEIDGKNLNAREVLKAAYEHAVEFEEGTIIRKSIDFTKGSKGMLELMHGLPDGHVFQNPGSMCCSLKEGWNQSSWGGEAVLELVYAKGAKGLYNIGIGSHDNEGEVTTLPGQRFMLLESAKEKNGMKNFFKVLVLPPDDLYVGEILNKEASDHDKSELENAT